MNVMLSILSTIFFLPSAISDFTFSRSAFDSSPSTIRPSIATTVTPSTSRVVIFNATLISSWSVYRSGGNPARNGKAYMLLVDFAKRSFQGADRRAILSSSPRRTCNTRTRCKSTCSVATPAAANIQGKTVRHLPAGEGKFRFPPALTGQTPRPPRPLLPQGRFPAYRSVSRPLGYSTDPGSGKAQPPRAEIGGREFRVTLKPKSASNTMKHSQGFIRGSNHAALNPSFPSCWHNSFHRAGPAAWRRSDAVHGRRTCLRCRRTQGCSASRAGSLFGSRKADCSQRPGEHSRGHRTENHTSHRLEPHDYPPQQFFD